MDNVAQRADLALTRDIATLLLGYVGCINQSLFLEIRRYIRVTQDKVIMEFKTKIYLLSHGKKWKEYQADNE